MSDLDAPSFSLGLDFDTPDPPPPLKRLRRLSGPEPVMTYNNDDEDIEEFSSQEDPYGENKLPSPQPYSGSSNSKLSLHGHRVLTTQSTSKCKMTQKEQATDIPVSKSTGADSNTFTFPKLTVSPLRMFQLIDSDSDFDDPCASEYADADANKVNPSSKRKIHSSAKNPTMSKENRTNASESKPREHDLWDDFYLEKRFNIPTPALDEVCDEYFRSVKNNRTDPHSTNVCNNSREIKDCVQTRIIIENDGVHCKLDDSIPPAHHYFYNDDLRIQNLVRNRLPYFFPLCATKGENPHSASSVINYRSQFNHGESSKPQALKKANTGMASKSVNKNSRKSNFEEAPQDSGSWVNPRSSVGIPTDAGKRRVHAVGGQSSGYWFTSPEGKKVYISKTGQELTGRTAYLHFRKESGNGFKRSGGKKKSTGNKKSVSKNKSIAKKR